jgi:AcrR family transcriptional regulator
MRGRPAAGSDRDLWAALLSAAERCWVQKRSHLDVTSSEIAALAGTFPGMINYYFGSKSGLFSALVEARTTRSLEGLKKLTAALAADTGDPVEILVRGLFDAYWPSDTPPAIQSIVLVEILRPGSPIRAAFLRRGGGSRPFAFVRKLLEEYAAKGRFRRDLDAVATTRMILSLVMGPMVLAPMWQLADDDADLTPANREAWIARIINVVRAEVAPS